jgi:ligand-binding sensor domain-containing protein
MCRCSNNAHRNAGRGIAAKVLLLFMVYAPFAADSKSSWEQFIGASTITCIVVDGPYCWAGTDAGLACLEFASGNVTWFTNLNSPLPSNNVSALARGRDGALWIGTPEGLACLRGGNWQVYAGDNSPAQNGVTALTFDRQNRLYVGLSYGGVYLVENDRLKSLARSYPGFPLPMTSSPITSLAVDSIGRLWMAWLTFYTISGFACFDGSKWTTYPYRPWTTFPDWPRLGELFAAPDSSVWAIGQRERYDTWFTGFIRFHPSGIREYPDDNIPTIQNSAIDPSGDIWVATDTAAWTYFQQPPKSIPVQGNIGQNGRIQSLTFDSSGSAWTGFRRYSNDSIITEITRFTANDRQAFRLSCSNCPTAPWGKFAIGGGPLLVFNSFQCWSYDGAGWSKTAFQWPASQSTDDIIHDIYLGRDGTRWFVYDKTIWKIDRNNQRTILDSLTLPSLANGNISGFALDSAGQGWVSIKYYRLFESKFLSFDLSSGKVRSEMIFSDSGYFSGLIVAASDGSVWCSRGGNGIVQWTPTSGFKHFNTNNSGLYSNYIQGIEVGPDSSVWIGDGGLLRYKSGAWTRFDSSWTGLPGKNCTPLAVESNGNLWAAVFRTEIRNDYTSIFSSSITEVYSKPAGIACFDGKAWTQYTTLNSGLSGNSIGFVATIDGTVCISSTGGLSIFQPKPNSRVNPPGNAALNKLGPSLSIAIDGKNVRFALLRPGTVFLTAFDCKGRPIASFNAGQRTAGAHMMPMAKLFNCQEPSSEMVILKVSTADGDHVERRIPFFKR